VDRRGERGAVRFDAWNFASDAHEKTIIYYFVGLCAVLLADYVAFNKFD
jgi:hypothetical protein